VNQSLSAKNIAMMFLCVFLYGFGGNLYAESVRPPCMRFLYIESYDLEKAALPEGLEIVRVKAVGANAADDDYLDYHLKTPILLEEGSEAFLKLENGKVFKNSKKRFNGLQGAPGNPLLERWPEKPTPSLSLRLSRLARLEQEINPPFRFGSNQRIHPLPQYPFSIKGLSSPKWENAKIVGVPFQISGKVFYREVERKCPSSGE